MGKHTGTGKTSKGGGGVAKRRWVRQRLGPSGFPDVEPKDIGETSVTATIPNENQRASQKPGAARNHGPRPTMDTKYDMSDPAVRVRVIAEREAAARLREHTNGNSGEKGN